MTILLVVALILFWSASILGAEPEGADRISTTEARSTTAEQAAEAAKDAAAEAAESIAKDAETELDVRLIALNLSDQAITLAAN